MLYDQSLLVTQKQTNELRDFIVSSLESGNCLGRIKLNTQDFLTEDSSLKEFLVFTPCALLAEWFDNFMGVRFFCHAGHRMRGRTFYGDRTCLSDTKLDISIIHMPSTYKPENDVDFGFIGELDKWISDVPYIKNKGLIAKLKTFEKY